MLKEEGNKHFKAGSYSQAVEMYKKAKANVEKSTSPDMKELKRACALNLANCFLNMQQYTPCVQECTEVLQGELHCALYPMGHVWRHYLFQMTVDKNWSLYNALFDVHSFQIVGEDMFVVV